MKMCCCLFGDSGRDVLSSLTVADIENITSLERVIGRIRKRINRLNAGPFTGRKYTSVDDRRLDEEVENYWGTCRH
jgi:hypothetical protein